MCGIPEGEFQVGKRSAWSHRGKKLGADWSLFVREMVDTKAGKRGGNQTVISCVRYAKELGLDLPRNGKLLPETHKGTSSYPPSKSV